MKNWYKICPYCGEEIREEAIKCRFCHEFLNEKTASLEIYESRQNLKSKKVNNTDSNKRNQAKGKVSMTCWKRFWLYIFYLIRNIFIYLILSGMSSAYRTNPYSDGWFAFDMFVCFIIFVVETIRLISDCSKIKKWIW